MAEPLEDAVESEDKKIALIIAILALFLALAEAGAKNAEHRSTEQNIEFVRSVQFLPSQEGPLDDRRNRRPGLRGQRAGTTDPKAQEALEKQIADWKAVVAKYEKDPKHPEDSLDAIQERAMAATEGRELSNHKLEHFEYASGALQIAIVLASAAIITGMSVLAWIAAGLGAVGAILMAFGYLAPTVLSFLS